MWGQREECEGGSAGTKGGVREGVWGQREECEGGECRDQGRSVGTKGEV